MPKKQTDILVPYTELDNWHSVQYHDLCTLFPPMTDEEYDELVGSMKEHGFYSSDPIILIDDDDAVPMVLDGRNRHLAAMDADATPEFMMYTGDDPLGFVTARNVNRRHLTTGQKAAIASKIATLTTGQNTNQGTSRKEAADAVGTTDTAIKRFRAVQEFDPALAAAVESGAVTLNNAYQQVESTKKKNQESNKAEMEAAKANAAEHKPGEPTDERPPPQEEQPDHDGEKAPPGGGSGQRPVKASIDRGPFNTEFEQKHPICISGFGDKLLRCSLAEARMLRDWLDTAIGKYESGK